MTENGKAREFFSIKRRKKIFRKFWSGVLSEVFRIIALLIEEYENRCRQANVSICSLKQEKKIWVKKNLFGMLKTAKIRLPFFPLYVERIIISLIVDLLIDFLEYFQNNNCGEENAGPDTEEDEDDDDYEDDDEFLIS